MQWCTSLLTSASTLTLVRREGHGVTLDNTLPLPCACSPAHMRCPQNKHDLGAPSMQVLFIHRCDILREGERHASGGNVHYVDANALMIA